MGNLQDTFEPLEEVKTAGGVDLRAAEGEELYIQRIIRLWFTLRGELYHRPEVGGELQEFQNKPPTPTVLQQIANRAGETLDSLEWVEDYSVDVWHADGVTWLQAVVVVNGQQLKTPEVSLGNP